MRLTKAGQTKLSSEAAERLNSKRAITSIIDVQEDCISANKATVGFSSYDASVRGRLTSARTLLQELQLF